MRITGKKIYLCGPLTDSLLQYEQGIAGSARDSKVVQAIERQSTIRIIHRGSWTWNATVVLCTNRDVRAILILLCNDCILKRVERLPQILEFAIKPPITN